MANVATTGAQSLPDYPPAPQPRSKYRLLVWAVGIIVIGGMATAVSLPSLCRAREPANRVKCGSNLRQIGQAIALYAQKHGGQYPPSLAVLTGAEEIGSDVLICPSSNDEKAAAADTAGVLAELKAAETNAPGHTHCLSYVYVGPALNSNTVSASAVVAYENLDNHDGDGTNVLFGDAHVEFVSKQEWSKLAATAGVAVVPSLTTRP